MTQKAFNAAMGKVIRKLRKTHGRTQLDVGKHIGVTYQQVQKSETGINGFAAHYLPQIAELFGVTVAYLFEQAGHAGENVESTDAENDSYLAARYVAKIADPKLRGVVVDFTRKLAYQAGEAA